MEHAGFQTKAEALAFILAGSAIFTATSLKTGTSYTFKVTKKEDRKVEGKYIHFVSVLTGPDNSDDYTYLGLIGSGGRFFPKRERRETPSAKAFSWLWARLAMPQAFPFTVCELRHEGRCGRCGRRLTVPESIDSGIGPVCAERAA